MIQNPSNRPVNVGLLILRIGIGIAFIFHGIPKMIGGPETWAQIGKATSFIGIEFAPVFFGFMSAFAELFGGVFLILGLFFTPATILMLINMLVALAMQIGQGSSFNTFSHPLESAILFLSLIIIGPGKYSMDQRLSNK